MFNDIFRHPFGEALQDTLLQFDLEGPVVSKEDVQYLLECLYKNLKQRLRTLHDAQTEQQAKWTKKCKYQHLINIFRKIIFGQYSASVLPIYKPELIQW